MALPQTLKVGPHVFSVKKDPGMGERKDGILGECKSWECHFIVDTNLPKTKQEEVLIHEILHAAHDVCGIQSTDKMNPETWVTRVSGPLYMILQENHMLVFPEEDSDG